VAALSIGPDETDAHLCALLQRLPWLSGNACLPVLGHYALMVVSIVAAVCFIALLIDWGVWFHKRRKSLHPKPQDDQTQIRARSSAGPNAVAENHVARRPFLAGVHVHKMQFQTSKLESEKILHITVYLFNGTGEEPNLIQTGGTITVHRKERPTEGTMKLPRPHFVGMTTAKIPADKEFYFSLAQDVPSRFVNDLNGQVYVLNFKELNIRVQSVANPINIDRLPLWDRAEIWRDGTKIGTNRLYDQGPDSSKWPVIQSEASH
jgi:hypothetical protein